MAKGKFERTKPHANVGTIGHIDHGKTTLTAALLAVLSKTGKAEIKSYADIAKGGTVRDETKTVTIAAAHVEYESDKRHYAHVDCPRPCGLRQEHDHGRRADGRRDPGGQRRGRPDAADARTHPAGPPGWCARDCRGLNKVDLVDDPDPRPRRTRSSRTTFRVSIPR